LMCDLSELTDTAYCLVVAKVRERMPVSKQATQKKIWYGEIRLAELKHAKPQGEVTG